MKHIHVMILLILLLPALAVGAEMSVLFIGNSHTQVNNLPELFRQLTEAAERDVYVDQSTFGGYTLERHAENSATLAKIAERSWDRVVLQEHSLYPVIPWIRDNRFFPGAALLDSLIHDSGSATALFMTWGWELGGEFCIDDHCSPLYPDYNSMQRVVSAAYGELALDLDALLVPVGNMWAVALHHDPTLPLWLPDHYHPSPEGSYFTACVFFARLLGESPVGLKFYGSLDPERGGYYQELASRIITGIEQPIAAPSEPPVLLPNHPNPFNPVTNIAFELPCPGAVELELYTSAGRLVEVLSPGSLPAGGHRIRWDAADLPSGVYLCRLRVGGAGTTGKLTLLR